MALTSETQPSPNGVNCIENESAEIFDDVDLEDGEIFEDEEPNSSKTTVSEAAESKESENPVKTEISEVPGGQKTSSDPEKNHKSHEASGKPQRENVPFLIKGKRKHSLDGHEDGRWRKDGKRSRRSTDLDRDGERMAEEEELMLVRGASPSRIEEELDKWARDGEDIEREMNRRSVRSFRGRGSVGRRGERSRGRGRGGRGNLRGKRRRDDGDTCRFFLQGKCREGSECPYSHEILPPRKMELCKFFMKDCCAKKDKCLYMHSEFPCKYYHMGLKCYAKNKCKFNHGVLTDTLKNILAKHLDTAPKDILGEFPQRDGRDRDRGDMRDRDPRDMRGDPRDMRGDQRDMRGDLRDNRGDPRDMRGDSRDMRGDLRDVRGDSRDMRGEPRDLRGDPRDLRGDPRDLRLDPRDMRGDPRDMRGDTRDVRGDLRDIRPDSRDMRGDPRDIRVDSRDMRGDPRDMRVDRDSRDVRGDAERRIGDLRDFLRSRGDRDKRLPAMFDMRVDTPDEARHSDGNHTPMPSPTQRSQDSQRSNEKDRDHNSSEREREKEKGRERDRDHEKHRHDKSERHKEKKAKREKSKEHKKERRERREKEREKRREAKEKNEKKIEDINKLLEAMSSSTGMIVTEKSPNVSEVSNPNEEQEKKSSPLEENGVFPQHLPKKQRELFLRIQQQQREAESSQEGANEDEDDIAEENWYSSDEEGTPSTSLPSILHNLTQTTTSTTSTSHTVTTTSNTDTNSTVLPLLNLLASAAANANPANQTSTSTPLIPPNLDLSNLTSVFEALQKLNASSNLLGSQQETATSQATATAASTVKTEVTPQPPPPEPPKPEPPRVRDPRLRLDGSVAEGQRRSSLESCSGDTDFRLKSATKPQSPPSTDVDLRSLPFKPVQHSAACEIDASLASHPPLTWELTPITLPKTDYASLQIQPKPGTNDPRLRLMVRAVADESGVPRDPRHRLVDEPIRDPRSRQSAIMSPPQQMSGPPPTPRYDEDHRPQFYHLDSDMRQFPPPTPRLEDEVYTPGPSRPVDPRQRTLSLDDPRRSHFPVRPDDTDLRTQMARVPFVNFTK